MDTRLALIVAAVIAAGCSRSFPTAPSTSAAAPTPTPAPATVTLAGRLTSTNGGAPLSAAMDFGVASTTSSASGAYRVVLPVTAPTLTLTITGANVITRRAYVAPGARTVNLDAINQSGFDLAFYRALVRNGFEAPNSLQPIRHLLAAPRIYLKNVDEAGRPIDPTTLTRIAAVFAETAPSWTNGRFGIAGVEQGAGTREGQAGWLTVVFDAEATSYCGSSYVGLDGGVINFAPRTPGCSCPGAGIRLRTMRHELGHAFGFWHTGDAGDLMSGLPVSDCDTPLSARELATAAIAYARPVGNMDPDTDPSSTVNLAPRRVR